MNAAMGVHEGSSSLSLVIFSRQSDSPRNYYKTAMQQQSVDVSWDARCETSPESLIVYNMIHISLPCVFILSSIKD